MYLKSLEELDQDHRRTKRICVLFVLAVACFAVCGGALIVSFWQFAYQQIPYVALAASASALVVGLVLFLLAMVLSW